MPGLFKDFGTEEGGKLAVSLGRALQSFGKQEKGNPGGEGSFTSAALSTSAVSVEHNLGTIPKGWIVIDRNADESVYRSAESTASHVTLTASGDVAVTLWIF